MLNDWLRKNDIEFSASVIDRLCKFHDVSSHEAFFQALGNHSIILGENDIDEITEKKKTSATSSWRRYVPFLRKSGKKKEGEWVDTLPVSDNLLTVGPNFNKKRPCIISEKTIRMYLFSQCCHPIPGDDILGFIDGNSHVTIHKRSCPVASKLKTSFGTRILDAQWDMHHQLFFDATIELHGIDRKGMLHDVSEVISHKLNTNIHQVSFSVNDGIFEGRIEIRVHDREEVRNIMKLLKEINDMQEVQQIL